MDDKKTFEEIQAEITEASQAITVGGTYQHYKKPDMKYKVVLLATRESDNELCVVYQALYGPQLYFTRPVREWLETVDWQGSNKLRFTPAEEE